ncbi:hypothetical protein BDQ17DRAFT_1332438 [Cyathus striatus]|nr:hypothetical protein BDQ17DRAFT_1332438 [Cyathus striatus]
MVVHVIYGKGKYYRRTVGNAGVGDRPSAGNLSWKDETIRNPQRALPAQQSIEVRILKTLEAAWWDDPQDENRARVQAALISGGAAGLGTFAAWAVRDVSVSVLGGSRRWGTWWDLIFVPVGCVVLVLGVVAAGIGFGLVQHPAHEDTDMPKGIGMSEGTKTNAQGSKSSDDDQNN